MAPALPGVHALADMVGQPASSVTDDLINAALDEVERALREPRRG